MTVSCLPIRWLPARRPAQTAFVTDRFRPAIGSAPMVSVPHRAARGAVALAMPLALVLAAARPALATPSTTPAPATTQVIVQLAGAPTLTAGTDVRPQAAAHAAFRQNLAAAGIQATVTHEFSQLFNGYAVTTDAAGAARLRTLPGVRAVYSGPARCTPALTPTWPDQRTPGLADERRKGTAVKGRRASRCSTPGSTTPPRPRRRVRPRPQSRAGLRLRQRRRRPDGRQRPRHPCRRHHRRQPHEPGGRTGVAPAGDWRVQGVRRPRGAGSESKIIAGLEAAVAPDNPYRADVVNLSLSGDPAHGRPARAADEAAIHAGVVVVAAAGNNGPGARDGRLARRGPDVLAVGASITGVDLPTVTVTTPVRQALGRRADVPVGEPAGARRGPRRRRREER